MRSKKSKNEYLFDTDFWDHPEDWPHDLPGYVFLARAFNELGRATHGERWDQSAEKNDQKSQKSRRKTAMI